MNVGGIEFHLPRLKIRVDVNPSLSWSTRDRVLVEKSYLKRTELGHFVLCPKDDAISILSFAENACGEGGREKFALLENEARHGSGGGTTLLRDLARKAGQGVAGIHRILERETEQAFGDNEAQGKIDESGVSGDNQRKFLHDVWVLGKKTSVGEGCTRSVTK